MNLFVVGSGRAGTLSPALAQGALEEVASPIPRLRNQASEGWTAPDGSAVAACLAHPPEDLGAVSYRAFLPDAMALFAGRPISWRGDADADGRGPLDPRSYLRPTRAWRSQLDGRYSVARWTAQDGLEVFTDPLARLPVYLLEGEGGSWVSNSARALALIAGDSDVSAPVLAHFFACGWSMGGDPVWQAVRCVERGTRVSLRDGTVTHTQDVLPDEELPALFGGERQAAAAADIMVAASRALATWPGRSVEVGLSGGYDSRLVLAAAVRSGIEFDVVTKALPNVPGYPETPDVVVARQVCAAAGLHQRIVDPGDRAGIFGNLSRAVALLRAVGPGTVSLADSHELPLTDDGPPPLLFSGLGGEVAKVTYETHDGDDESADAFARRIFAKVSPGTPARLVNSAAEADVIAWIRSWAERHSAAGVAAADRPSLFHLLVRAGRWAAAGVASRDHGFDSVLPIGARPLLSQQLSLPLEERGRNSWHTETTASLDPVVASIAYEHLGVSFRARLVKEARRRAAVETRRLLKRPRAERSEPFAAAVRTTAEAVAARPDHTAWAVLDRSRVEKLLRRDPDRLDPRSRQQVLRLATVFIEP